MDTKLIFRPVRETDHDSLQKLIGSISGGMTSLPDHSDYLEERISYSLRAFDHRVSKPGGETYLFVLEDLDRGELVGTSGLLSRVGGFDPFYTYKIQNNLQVYEPQNVRNNVQTLELVKNHKGPSEICSLFLHPDYRKHGVGKLLSKSRFCFMKAFPERFDSEIIAELRGFLDESGRSPFWEGVGKNFFWRDYYRADVLSGIGEKDFIEALMPEHPIYIKLLPKETQEKIGAVHAQSEPARQILLKEGFQKTDEVDIFDAGPILKAQREQLLSWKNCQTVLTEAQTKPFDSTGQYLITNNQLAFRATLAKARLSNNGLSQISGETAEILQVESGDSVQFLQIG